VEFLFQQTRADFGTQVPQRNLPWEGGFYDGPNGPAHEAADNVAFWHKLAAFYAQDQWKVRPDLALSFGLLYDLDFLPSASDLRIIGKMNPTSLAMFNHGLVWPMPFAMAKQCCAPASVYITALWNTAASSTDGTEHLPSRQ
jgi:hypothetical protein